MGVMCLDGWMAYARDGHVFVKTFNHFPDAAYPDFGCSAEIFANSDMVEIETFGPLARLGPDEMVEHVENWYLFRDVAQVCNEADVKKSIVPLIGLVGHDSHHQDTNSHQRGL